jgi:hypothetical protein
MGAASTAPTITAATRRDVPGMIGSSSSNDGHGGNLNIPAWIRRQAD